MPSTTRIQGRLLVSSSDCGNRSSLEDCVVHPVLVSSVSLSFWGGVDPLTSVIIDATHPLHGCAIVDTILFIPSGRGSCTGSQVLLELIRNGLAPRAIVTRDVDGILCVGPIIAQEIFGDEDWAVPDILCIGDDGFETITARSCDESTVATISSEGTLLLGPDLNAVKFSLQQIEGRETEEKKESTDNLKLTKEEQRMLDEGSPAEQIAMRTITRLASIMSSPNLLPVTQAHIDGCTYIGPGGLAFVQHLVDLGGKVCIPTTLNSVSADRRRWKELGMNEELAVAANSVGDAYLKLGCNPMSFTCAPYLLPESIPKLGDNIIWGESNAVVFANSVLGARTDKYADYFDICCALVGRVPAVGVHLDENRQPGILLDVTCLVMDCIQPIFEKEAKNDNFELDAFFPTLGYLCGNMSDGRVPLIVGMDSIKEHVSMDDLKAFCAAFGTTGTAPLFHMAGITPEAKDPIVVQKMIQNNYHRRKELQLQDLKLAFDALDSGGQLVLSSDTQTNQVDLVAFGNPHLSITECERLVKIVTESNVGKKNENVDIKATLSRRVFEEAQDKGYISSLEKFGFSFINDTCWCMLLHPPVIPPKKDAVIMTNSGKYAHYGPGLTNRRLRFGSMQDCIRAATLGKWNLRGNDNDSRPRWLSPTNYRRQPARNYFSDTTFQTKSPSSRPSGSISQNFFWGIELFRNNWSRGFICLALSRGRRRSDLKR
mmetsp:Transcript_8247/g.14902  ORF Transcript_8247/g.14902 Transcript_8247/m.14902 type:complete len:714 (-) Transcript_8247:92-2233(-)